MGQFVARIAMFFYIIPQSQFQSSLSCRPLYSKATIRYHSPNALSCRVGGDTCCDNKNEDSFDACVVATADTGLAEFIFELAEIDLNREKPILNYRGNSSRKAERAQKCTSQCDREDH